MIENMSEQENMILRVHQVGPDGTINETVKIEIDPSINIVSESTYTEVNNNINNYALNWEFQDDDKIRFHFPEEENPTLTVIKVEVDGELNQTSYATQINSTTNSAEVISCQNCEKKFTTKYHYQRHTCEFNADKVVLKPEVKENKTDSDVGLVKMIENMIHTMEAKNQKENDNSSPANTNIKVEDNNEDTSETGKKKRGRKRKYPKPEISNRNLTLGESCQYQCERCIKCFNDIAAMDQHKETVHATTHKCDQCGQVLQSAKALMIHSRAHQSLKPYVCDQCGRSYSQTSHLWQHMRFHQGIKPFACPHEGCEARYTIRPDLKDHIRKVHTRERPFKCSVCEKSFLTGSVYYQHRLIHTNDRRYGCEICNKRFFRADALNNHRRIHTDERPYPCPVCGREFRQKGDRNKHVRTQHSI
ncbi:matotopetli [Carabus blaptoides fortunei]